MAGCLAPPVSNSTKNYAHGAIVKSGDAWDNGGYMSPTDGEERPYRTSLCSSGTWSSW